MRKILACIFIVGLLSSRTVFAQDISSKRDIAIFRMSSQMYEVPEFLYAASDDAVLRCLSSLTRFRIIGLETRFEAYNLDDFIRRIQSEREKTAEIPEEVHAGKMVFTRADWEKLVSSYIVVLPIINDFELVCVSEQLVDSDDDGKLDTIIRTYSAQSAIRFILLNMQTTQVIGDFTIENFGTAESPKKAVMASLLLFPEKLEYELRKINAFKIRSGVSKVSGDMVEFELGRNMGISVGDEFALLKNEYAHNSETERETGLMMVTHVAETTAQAKILYANEGVVFADQLSEVPRLPLEFKFAGNVLFNTLQTQRHHVDMAAGFSITAIQTRGFYRFRPFYGLESTFSQKTLVTGLPLRVFVGGQLGNIFIGRFQFSPELSFGAQMLMKHGSEKPQFSGLNLRATLSFNFLVSRDIKVCADTGFDFEVNMLQTAERSSFRPQFLFQLGLVIK